MEFGYMVLLGMGIVRCGLIISKKKIVCFSCPFISGYHYHNTVSGCSFIQVFLLLFYM